MNAKSRRRYAAMLGTALLALTQISFADTYPSRPIKVVAPYAAGGAIDIVARTLSDPVGRALGQPMVVDNKTGAAGNLGVDAVAKAAPDGYTLTVALSSNLMINQFLYAKLPYNPGKDLTLIAKVADAPLVLVVNSHLGVNNLADLRKYVQAHKGKMSYGCGSAVTRPPRMPLQGEALAQVMTVVAQAMATRPALPDVGLRA